MVECEIELFGILAEWTRQQDAHAAQGWQRQVVLKGWAGLFREVNSPGAHTDGHIHEEARFIAQATKSRNPGHKGAQ